MRTSQVLARSWRLRRGENRKSLQRISIVSTRFLLLSLALFVSYANAAIPASERAVLDTFYAQFNGFGNPTFSSWEVAGSDECTWNGITCDATRSHVVGIYFIYGNLTGTLPALDGLTQLQTLNITQNSGNGGLSGAIPPLANLPNLQAVVLDGNRLTGAIPSLAGLSHLTQFSAYNNRLTGQVPSLADLINLTQFNVSNNQLSGSFPSLAGLTQLQAFNIGENRFSGTLPEPPSPNQLGQYNTDLCSNPFVRSPSAAWDTIMGGTWYSQSGQCGIPAQLTIPNSANAQVAVDAPFTVSVIVGAAGNMDIPTGNVTIQDMSSGTTMCTATLTNGQGSCQIAYAQGGSYPISARYSGDVHMQPASYYYFYLNVQGNSNALAQPTLALTSSQDLAALAESVSLTATLSGAASMPTGTVEFTDGTSAISGCAAVVPSPSAGNYTASCVTSTSAVGAHRIVAAFSGDPANAAATSPAFYETVYDPSVVGFVLDPSAYGTNSSNYGAPVTFHAYLYGAPAVGTVSFTANSSVNLCSEVPIQQVGSIGMAACTTTSLDTYGNAISATYFDASHSLLGTAQTYMSVSQAQVQIAMSLSSTSIALGQSTTATVSVNALAPAAGSPPGNVSIYDANNNLLCQIALPATTCTLTPTYLGVQRLGVSYQPSDYHFAFFDSSYSNPSVNASIPSLAVSGASLTGSLYQYSNTLNADGSLSALPNDFIFHQKVKTTGFQPVSFSCENVAPGGVTWITGTEVIRSTRLNITLCG